MSIPIENLRRDLRTRLESDKQMSGAWAIVPLLPVIVGVVVFVVVLTAVISAINSIGPPGTTTTGSPALGAALAGSIFLLYFLYFVVLVLVSVLIFKLVSRRNTHFNRQILLQEDIITMAKEIAAKKGVDVSILLNNMERNVREARLEEGEKNATLYALLYGFVWIYTAYFLMKDFFKHERREDLFINDMLRAFNAVGVPINFPYRNPPIPDRSFALYFVLTLITGSIFGVYWVYVLVTDPNNHFRQQMLMEDTIMAQLSSTSPLASPIPSAPPN
ncbi:MAG: hypothetical protein AUI50_02185 [Crenarchaeota archaeon 13_1_40CM_2_52_14]|nr:MAG: hypothetical protein AUI97_09025 [Crenarchaeota archaeon 13_1_40CM_3_52_17]OLD35460.1 MAG: hypothetical protein AUI50_02185 [Crenarchaeota archaeon 13_1_40CM_2_52_14]OLE71748.1 MAG: hypothetical protein AUF78_00630 [archaeon 13_1_20CM_2_51_12]